MTVAWRSRNGGRGRFWTGSISLVVVAVISSSCATLSDVPRNVQAAPSPIVQHVPGTIETLRMMPVQHDDRVIWISSMEITWDLYDLFVYGKGGEEGEDLDDVDAITRPTQPYIAMDRGFGRHGYPAISMSFKGAQQFCVWLSQRTGRTYRLPTVTEWRAACVVEDGVELNAIAWHAGNAERTTHPVGTKKRNALGLHDMLGNVAEWCVDENGVGVVLGGSFRNQPAEMNCSHQQTPTPAWNASDPQFPPSEWWLADAPFVGFRVVLDDAAKK